MLFSSISNSQIVVENTLTPEELVESVLIGTGVTVSNIEFNASVPLAGMIQAQAGFFDASGTTFPINEGILLATGNVSLAIGPNDAGGATDNTGVAVDPDDPDLTAIGTASINNEAILEFDFIPSGDSVIFNYIFASEEYLEFVDAGFNDVFGFFISGPGFAGPFTDGAENIATIPGTMTPVTIDNLNDMDFPELYVNNDRGLDVQYDGHTVVLSARASVECGETYHIKMAIGDAGDMSLDSGVFLEANSFSSNGINVEIASALGADAISEGCDTAVVCFIRPEEADTTDLMVDFEIGGTAINGVDYDMITESVFFPMGEDTVKVLIIPSDDGDIEGTETLNISVEIINECGDTIITEASIEITDPVDYNIITTDTTIICPQDSIFISFETDGGIPEFDIDWSSGGTDFGEWVPGDIVGTTTYTIDVVDVCGVASSGSVDVTLDPAPLPTITFVEDEFIICPGAEVSIDATVTGAFDSDAITYSWDPTGVTTEDLTTSPTDAGFYVLTVFDGCNTVSDSVEVEFGGVNITDITVVDATDCPGVMDAELGSVTVMPDNPLWSYELVGFGPPQDNGNFDDVPGGVDYILIVINESGCITDTIVSVSLGSTPVDATWAPDSLRNISCFGANDGGAFIFDITGGVTPPYDVSWTTTSGVFDMETVGVDESSEQDNLPPGSWIVTVVDQEGCAWSQSFEITEPDELILDLIFNEPTCFGFSDGSVTANTEGGNGGETFTMSDATGTQLNIGNSNTINTLTTGWYFIEVVDENGCSVSDSLFLDQPGELDIDLTINQPLCFGLPTGSAVVDSVFNFTGDYDQISYFWAPNLTGDNGIGFNSITKLGEGPHTITINDENGCSNVFNFDIIYPDSLFFNSDTGFDPAFCRVFDFQNGNGQVFASASGGAPDYTYLWTDLSDPTSTTTNTTWGGRNPGDYRIVATDANGCTIERIVTVDSLNPIAAFTTVSDNLNSDCQGVGPIEVEFCNTSQNFANPLNPLADTTFFWNLDCPNATWQISEDINEKFDTTYALQDVTYTVDVALVATNKNGCTDTTKKTITIFADPVIPPLNIFTPNGDGDNDLFSFGFKAIGISEFNCVIVNRWGVQVAELTSIIDTWDGTDLNGSPLNDGVYFYSFEATSDNNLKFERQGTVTIAGSE